jgi:hypothetical protein
VSSQGRGQHHTMRKLTEDLPTSTANVDIPIPWNDPSSCIVAAELAAPPRPSVQVMESADKSPSVATEPGAPPMSSTRAMESDNESPKASDTRTAASLFRFIPSGASPFQHRKRHRSGSGSRIESQRKVSVPHCEAHLI